MSAYICVAKFDDSSQYLDFSDIKNVLNLEEFFTLVEFLVVTITKSECVFINSS